MQEMKYFNEGNDCDICKNQLMTGRDGTVEDCRRRQNGLSCRFEERDIRTCPVCEHEVDREDMYFTTNAAYDPRNNNCMCINGQLMLLDLIEHLEAVPGLELIQSNTDGLIIWIPDTDEAFNMVDDICWEWEQRCSTEQCSILLELDNISEIYQKDVNNYLWVDIDGGVERIGAYVKERK